MQRNPKELLEYLKTNSKDFTITSKENFDKTELNNVIKEVNEINIGLGKGIKIMKDSGREIDKKVLENQKIIEDCLAFLDKLN